MPHCARFSCRRSHIYGVMVIWLSFSVFNHYQTLDNLSFEVLFNFSNFQKTLLDLDHVTLTVSDARNFNLLHKFCQCICCKFIISMRMEATIPLLFLFVCHFCCCYCCCCCREWVTSWDTCLVLLTATTSSVPWMRVPLSVKLPLNLSFSVLYVCVKWRKCWGVTWTSDTRPCWRCVRGGVKYCWRNVELSHVILSY